MIHDEQRSALTIAVTGTNGKTTTTRLLAHIFRTAGQSVGWSSSSGVYINGEEVLSGDYSGPRGAERVLTDPDVDIAITETARGGILLRGVVMPVGRCQCLHEHQPRSSRSAGRAHRRRTCLGERGHHADYTCRTDMRC